MHRLAFVALLGCASNSPKNGELSPNSAKATKSGPRSGHDLSATATKILQEARVALPTISSELRVVFAAAALADAEAGRLPQPVLEALAGLGGPAEAVRSAEVFLEPAMMATFQKTCHGNAHQAFMQVAQSPPNQQTQSMWQVCQFDRQNLLPLAQAESAPVHRVSLAFLIHQLWNDMGGATEDELTLLKTMVTGAPEIAESAPEQPQRPTSIQRRR